MSAEKQKTILLVEDEAIIAMSEKMTLENFGYNTIIAGSGEAAVATVAQIPDIDLILMDINLGAGMDGTEAAAIILEERDLPVVFLSSHTEPEVVAKTEKITSYGYVVKNSSITVLDASIKMAFKLFEAKTRELKKEEALRESEASYRVLFSGASDGILVANAQTKRFRFANPAICRMMGYTEEEFLRLSVADIHPKESLDHVLAEFEALALGEIRSSPDLPCLRKDGTIFHADISHSMIVLAGQEYQAGFFHDITARKRAEKEKEQIISVQRATIESTADGILVIDHMGNITDFNQSFARMWRIPDSVLAARNDAKALGFVLEQLLDPQAFLTKVNELYAAPDQESFDLLQLKDGRYFERYSRPQLISGQPVGRVWSFRDITERKQAESQNKAALESLQESEERFHSFFDNSNAGIYRTAPEGSIHLANPALIRMLGYSSFAELAEKNLNKTGFEPSYPRTQFVVQIEKDGEVKGLESVWKRKDGANIFVRESARAIRNASGKTLFYDGIVENVTEIMRSKKLTETLYGISQAIYSTDELDELYRHIHGLIAGIVPANNFFIALLSDDGKALTFPYSIDEKDSGDALVIAADDPQSLSVEVLSTKKPLLLDETQLGERYATGRNKVYETAPKCWLGVPLCIRDKVIGVMVIQDYRDGSAYAQGDVILLESTAGQIAIAIDRKRAEKALRESMESFKGYFNMGTVGMCVSSLEKGWIEVNDCLCRMLGYARKELLRLNWDEMTHPDDLNADLGLFNQVLAGERDSYELEKRFIRKDGQVIHTLLYVTCQRHPEGTVHLFLASLVDISERKRAEEEIKRQLAEKEVLLREIHHRIKNNIASISGLLSLRLRSITNPEAAAALQDAIGRVDSMRILYDKLLLSTGYQDIPVKDYVESLIDMVIAQFPGDTRIALDKRIDDFPLDPKRLFPLGIIINELLTNIMKYAFAGKKSGTIKLSLTKDGSRVTLTLQDDGVGLPDGFDMENSKGFGLMLVKMLSQQLAGSFSMEKHAGTRCVVEFNA